ncbi:cob(I)yrinic acid a,c-diamide adenosyltransferase [Sphingobium indicum]|uniref:Corrinoid adenosyltransferase n=1 Tax=Sphingobium indicum F2 TaxID=1450518 RepID=A0A8E0WP95_9SPHN|nr:MULTISPECIES: cob(I)yrinic acid a,c-diamide adenosyltransferase [Sphingobium]KER34816.1 cob(I)yrinic acid a c-diamide adenosyltransferase [Sphingobium indicum F2]KER34996.1 cob(I)yrinic acid a c-diamide adenosyltransferase [Sphingobium indicum F2]KER36019.1 cob(I)yrinic acid a c-diamide adenosyltransferase [Sphingobium indicum F2]
MVKLNKIYTRTGDGGTTGLVDGSRLPKHAPRMQAVGDVDEANSAIGLAVIAIGDSLEAGWLTTVQNDLFDLGADLATPIPDGEDEPWALRIVALQVERLERQIDVMNADLAPLDSFVLPGGSAAAAAVHLARAVTRRAERSATAAAAEVALNPHALAYLNRLSDLLFVLARRLNGNGAGDVKWVPGASR